MFLPLQHVKYVRSHEEDRDLGLLDMLTENYNPEVEAELAAEEAARNAATATATATAATEEAKQ